MAIRDPAKRAKPGLTSTSPGDSVRLRIDTSLGLGDAHGGGGAPREQPSVQLTYLRSYEQAGVLSVECTAGCSCAAQRIQTLDVGALATLHTAAFPVREISQSGSACRRMGMRSATPHACPCPTPAQVSEGPNCTLTLRNVSPRKCPTALVAASGPCTKLKVVALAVAVSSHRAASSDMVRSKLLEGNRLDFL